MSVLIILDDTIWIDLPDGRQLSARLWLPKTGHSYPVIFEYLPYRKRDGTAERDATTHAHFVKHGYASIRVDIAGTGDSYGQTLRDDQLDQIARLGMSVSFFSAHIYYWGDLHYTTILGPARAERISPAASAQQRGIRFTIHNDASVTPTRPLHLAHCAVERQTYGGRILGKAKKISRLFALRAMTIDAAWQVFEDSKRGSIENGKLADLVILSENPLKTSKSLSDIRVMQTIRRGTIAYQA